MKSKQYIPPLYREENSQILEKFENFTNKVAGQVCQIMKDRLLKDEGPTGPKNIEEVDHLINFSFRKIEDAWEQIYASMGKSFIPATLVLYTDKTNIENRTESILSNNGPCYFGGSIYIDPAFFHDTFQKFYKGSEDFSTFYVLAHEYAHHVQADCFGDFEHTTYTKGNPEQVKIESIHGILNFAEKHDPESYHQATQISEQHADFLAGCITRVINEKEIFLHKNDILEGVETAGMVGDDMLAFNSGKEINPEKFTHSTHKMRSKAFLTGFLSGNVHQFDIETLFKIYLEQGVGTPKDHIVDIFKKR